MKRKILAFITIFAAAAIAVAQEKNSPSPLRSLVEAERGFARASVEKGTREAFIMNLADDANEAVADAARVVTDGVLMIQTHGYC